MSDQLPTAENSAQLLTISQTAQYLQCTERTVYSWVEQRKIPYFKIGKFIRFRTDELNKWIEQQIVIQGVKK